MRRDCGTQLTSYSPACSFSRFSHSIPQVIWQSQGRILQDPLFFSQIPHSPKDANAITELKKALIRILDSSTVIVE
jgi:hypothetical protein